jgi:hypothetical protein
MIPPPSYTAAMAVSIISTRMNWSFWKAKERRVKVRTFGWAVTIVVGGFATYLFVKSIPDMVRYAKLSAM